MVLMAIDHVRVYSGLPAGGAEAGIFFTRWVTHFCAPVFVFLTGTSAFLYGERHGIGALRRFLLSRGLLLIVLEFTVIRFCWTFNFNYSQFVLFGVIWMIGACMVLLALVVSRKPHVVATLGILVIFGQQLFGWLPGLWPEEMRSGWGALWEFIYPSGMEAPGRVTILYVLVPWIGVMMAGFGAGKMMTLPAPDRRKAQLWLGLGATVLFMIWGLVRTGMSEPGEMPFVLRLLNQQKYPASPLFLLMTLGPAILVMPWLETTSGAVSRIMVTFGRVPFFYYLLHIPVIHLLAVGMNLLREGRTFSEWYATAPYVWFQEDGHQWPLWLLYVVFAVAVAVLYLACRAYERYKFAHPEKEWLRWI